MRSLTLVAVSLSALLGIGFAPKTKPVKIEIHKTATCGCCGKWVALLEKEGYAVSVTNHDDLAPTKERLGVPKDLRSCHTAAAGGYVFEGHVPLDLVSKVLDKRPVISGLAVPGMPVGSPGMEQGTRRDPYNVIAFGPGAKQSVFAAR